MIKKKQMRKRLKTSKEKRLQSLQNQNRHVKKRLERLKRTSYRYSWVRLVIFCGGLLFSSLTLYLAGLWLTLVSSAAWGSVFGVIAYYHRQTDKSIERHQVWLHIKSSHIARMRLDWEQLPISFGYRPQAEHPFEVDLDLLGPQSLYRLLNTATSYEGSRRLRNWLTDPAPDPHQSIQRQRLVQELGPQSLFRDKLGLNAAIAVGANKTWRSDQLLNWLDSRPPSRLLRPWLWGLGGLAALNALLFILHRLGTLPPIWQFSFGLYFGLLLLTSKISGAVFDEAIELQDTLRQLGAVLEHLEKFSYRSTPNLKTLCIPFQDKSKRPSQYLRRVARVVAATGMRGNPLGWFALNALLPWDLYFAHRLDQCKAELAQPASTWIDVWSELEALNSLANFAYLHPHYTFPQILTASQQTPSVFQAENLGHPLITEANKVRNDLTIPHLGQIDIITGSNMAGKTVFIKTVGLNLALMQAGGPVDAQHLTSTPFRLFTCIKVSDSVTHGISYFYAEVKRLKALLAALEDDHPLPLFFYIDEIFRGTNNRERLIGSRAFVHKLVGKRGVGLIATHDLELAKLAEQTAQIKNYHFRDHFVEGEMQFDYTLRPGPSPTTNALKIMQMEGLISLEKT